MICLPTVPFSTLRSPLSSRCFQYLCRCLLLSSTGSCCIFHAFISRCRCRCLPMRHVHVLLISCGHIFQCSWLDFSRFSSSSSTYSSCSFSASSSFFLVGCRFRASDSPLKHFYFVRFNFYYMRLRSIAHVRHLPTPAPQTTTTSTSLSSSRAATIPHICYVLSTNTLLTRSNHYMGNRGTGLVYGQCRRGKY